MLEPNYSPPSRLESRRTDPLDSHAVESSPLFHGNKDAPSSMSQTFHDEGGILW